MAENKVFRKVSLDRLSSPEELDQRLTVTSPTGWLACLAIIMLVVTGIIWGIFGRIPDKAMGQGIIISSGGVTNVIPRVSGQITDVSVREGDYVVKGDVIARVEQTDITQEINKLKVDLEIIRELDPNNPLHREDQLALSTYGQIAEFLRDIEYARTSLDVQRANLSSAEKNRSIQLEQARWELDQATLQLEKAKVDYENLKYLYDNDGVSEQQFKDSERNYILSQSSLQNKKEQLRNLELEDNEYIRSQVRQSEKNLEVLIQTLYKIKSSKEKELETEIARLQEQLVVNSDITAGVSGRVVELQVKKGDLVQAGSNVCSIAREEGEGESLEAVVFIPVEKGKKVHPGMEVNISPTTVKKEEDGYMLGNVKSVSEYPVSAQGMMLTLGNPELVNKLLGQSSPVEVQVELIRDSSTVSGYKWSTHEGPDMIIDSGTLCIGEAKVSEQRPISMVIPFIRKMFFE